MLKVKKPKIGLMILASIFCLFLSGVAAEKECWDREGGGPTFTGNHNYPSDWFPAFQYDPNNPDVIDRNSSVKISVIGGIPSYTWQVSGTGFILSEGATKGLTNTLIANDTACGSATITVTDKRGTSCTGYIRCTEGKWVRKSTGSCIMSGTGTFESFNCDVGCHRIWTYTLIYGNKKQWQATEQICDAMGDYYTCAQLGKTKDNCIDPDHSPPERVKWDYYTDFSGCADPEGCEGVCMFTESVCVYDLSYWEWECS